MPSAWANEPQITALVAGEVAPFDGDLYPIDVSIRFGIEVESCAERAAAELDHAQALHEVEIAKEKALAETEAEANRKRVELLTAELDASRAWYRSPPFIATVAATTAVGCLLLSALLVQSTLTVEVRR